MYSNNKCIAVKLKALNLYAACWNSLYVSVLTDTQTNMSIEHGGQQRQRQVVVEMTSRGSDKNKCH